MAQVLPDALRVEVGYGSTPLTPLASVTWTDVTSSVRLGDGVQFSRGRFGNDALARPGSLSLTLDNSAQKGTAGRFTSGGSKVDLRLPIRVRAAYPFGTGSPSSLWVGYVESVQSEWDGGFRPLLRVTATDRLGRLQKRSLPSLIRGYQQTLAPVAQWPLDDSEGSTVGGEQSSATDVADMLVRRIGSAGSYEFGSNGLGASADQGQCLILTPNAGRTSGYYAQARSLGAAWAAATASTFEMFFYPTESGYYLVTLQQSINERFSALVQGPGGIADEGSVMYGAVVGGTVYGDLGSTSPVSLDHWHHVAVTQAVSGGNLTIKAFVDGTLMKTLTITGRGTVIAASTITMGLNADDSTLISGRLSHVALYDYVLSNAQIAANAALRYTVADFAAETAAAVFNRLGTIADMASSEYAVTGNTSASMSPVPVAGRSLLDAAEDVARAENGVVYLSRAGVLTLAARLIRYNPTSRFAIPAKTIDRATSFSTDMTYMVNDVTVSRPGGVTTRAVNSASVAAYDTHDVSVEARLADDNQAAELASRLARVNATPEPRVSDIAVDLVTAERAFILLEETFDTGSPSWMDDGAPPTTTAVTTEQARSGTKSLKITTTATGLVYVYATTPLDVVPNQSYTMTAWVRTVSGQRDAHLYYSWTDGSTYESVVSDDVSVGTSWTLLTLTAAAPSWATQVYYGPEWTATSSTESLYMDDVQVVAGGTGAIMAAEVGDYFQVTSLPTTAPASTLHLFVEGVSHDVSDSAWRVTMTTTPASAAFFRDVWVLGDANRSQLGSTTVLAF